MANDERESLVETSLQHELLGAPNCTGVLNALVGAENADIVCNGCGANMGTVPVEDLERALGQLFRSSAAAGKPN